MQQYLHLGDRLVLTDAKSRYHHIPVDASKQTHLAVEWASTVKLFTLSIYPVCPFGSACKVFFLSWDKCQFVPVRKG